MKLATKTFLASAFLATATSAAEINTNTAQMQAMDKITGRVDLIDVPINTEIMFGSFSIVVRECKTRPPEETPENFAFVDVVDTTVGKESVNIFKGWMISSSPAMNAIEHPVYDVWLIKCYDTADTAGHKMSEEELADRDYIELYRPDTQTDEIASDTPEPLGEPITLLPILVMDEAEAQREVLPLNEPMDAIPDEMEAESEPDKVEDIEGKTILPDMDIVEEVELPAHEPVTLDEDMIKELEAELARELEHE